MGRSASKNLSAFQKESRVSQAKDSKKVHKPRKHIVRVKEGVPEIVFESWVEKKRFQFMDAGFAFLEAGLKFFGLYERGRKNSFNIRLDKKEFHFASLPHEFDGLKILFLTDLHLGLACGLKEKIIEAARNVDADLCLFGGDYRYGPRTPLRPVLEEMRDIVEVINTPLGLYGVRGNHDPVELVSGLEKIGIRMLMNSSIPVKKGGQEIYLAGVDDPFHYKAHDLEEAFKNVPKGKFSIFMAHTPQLSFDVESFEPDFYLCGHTHNGQIRIPWLNHWVHWIHGTQQEVIYGKWLNNRIVGYTGAGVGASGVKVRFRCPPEIGVLTLKCKQRIQKPASTHSNDQK